MREKQYSFAKYLSEKLLKLFTSFPTARTAFRHFTTVFLVKLAVQQKASNKIITLAQLGCQWSRTALPAWLFKPLQVHSNGWFGVKSYGVALEWNFITSFAFRFPKLVRVRSSRCLFGVQTVHFRLKSCCFVLQLFLPVVLIRVNKVWRFPWLWVFHYLLTNIFFSFT